MSEASNISCNCSISSIMRSTSIRLNDPAEAASSQTEAACSSGADFVGQNVRRYTIPKLIYARLSRGLKRRCFVQIRNCLSGAAWSSLWKDCGLTRQPGKLLPQTESLSVFAAVASATP